MSAQSWTISRLFPWFHVSKAHQTCLYLWRRLPRSWNNVFVFRIWFESKLSFTCWLYRRKKSNLCVKKRRKRSPPTTGYADNWPTSWYYIQADKESTPPKQQTIITNDSQIYQLVSKDLKEELLYLRSSIHNLLII